MSTQPAFLHPRRRGGGFGVQGFASCSDLSDHWEAVCGKSARTVCMGVLPATMLLYGMASGRIYHVPQ